MFIKLYGWDTGAYGYDDTAHEIFLNLDKIAYITKNPDEENTSCLVYLTGKEEPFCVAETFNNLCSIIRGKGK